MIKTEPATRAQEHTETATQSTETPVTDPQETDSSQMLRLRKYYRKENLGSQSPAPTANKHPLTNTTQTSK
ncbi:hypothetical protein Pelo_19917 [Pelomyxa schiedti]|nr:hypothetical protein Pelo_19917 [Pelomyxa schiedti]